MGARNDIAPFFETPLEDPGTGLLGPSKLSRLLGESGFELCG